MAREYHEVDTRRTVVGPRSVERPATAIEQTDMVVTDPYAERRFGVARALQAVYLVFGVLEGLLVIRLLLKALGANPNAGFSSFIYNVTSPFLAPFAGMFGTPTARNGSVLEVHTIIAFIVYALLAWLVAKLIWLAFGETRTGVIASARDVDIDRPTYR
jgi:hypothetical protein